MQRTYFFKTTHTLILASFYSIIILEFLALDHLHSGKMSLIHALRNLAALVIILPGGKIKEVLKSLLIIRPIEPGHGFMAKI
jgi:hypothetical protein